MLHAGLDLSRRKIDVCLLSAGGEIVEEFASPPDADGLRGLARRVGRHGLAGAWGDRVDDRRAVRARPARGARLGCADRRRGQGQGPGAAGVQDRQDRRAGAGGAVAARPGAGDLAARSAGAARARAGALSDASGQAPLDAQAPHPRDADHLRAPVPGHAICSVSPAASCSTASTIPQPWRGTVDASLQLIDDLDRQIDTINTRAARRRRRPSLRAVAVDRSGDRLGAGVHDRRRDRRHRPLRVAQEAVRLHRAVPARAISPAIATAAAR